MCDEFEIQMAAIYLSGGRRLSGQDRSTNYHRCQGHACATAVQGDNWNVSHCSKFILSIWKYRTESVATLRVC